MTLDVREVVPADAASIREVARESWLAAYDEVLDRETISKTVDDWYAVDDLERSIVEARDRAGATFLVADADDEGVVGFAHARPWQDDPTVAYLIRIYVRPDLWDEGIGHRLLERLEADLEGAFDRLRLVVLADNDVGVSFYEATGFDRVETRESGLSEGLEEYVYEKSL